MDEAVSYLRLQSNRSEKNYWNCEWKLSIVFSVIDFLFVIDHTDQFSECGNRSISAILAMFFTDRKCSNQPKNNGTDARGQTKYEGFGTASASHWKFGPKRCRFFIRFGWTSIWAAASYYVPYVLCKLKAVFITSHQYQQQQMDGTVSLASFYDVLHFWFLHFSRSSFHYRKMILQLIWMQNITGPLPVDRIHFHRTFSQKMNQRFHTQTVTVQLHHQMWVHWENFHCKWISFSFW